MRVDRALFGIPLPRRLRRFLVHAIASKHGKFMGISDYIDITQIAGASYSIRGCLRTALCAWGRRGGRMAGPAGGGSLRWAGRRAR